MQMIMKKSRVDEANAKVRDAIARSVLFSQGVQYYIG